MLQLRKNFGRTLEPSAGDGAFSRRLPGCVALELDAALCPAGALNIDFFAYPETEKFDCIIGNPPFVQFKHIQPETKRLLDMTRFDERANLYLFFIEKCVKHLYPGGELILITPRDFLKATSAAKLNAWLHEQGSFTYLEDVGDAVGFAGHNPNCVVFRFEKGNSTHLTDAGQVGSCVNGQLLFADSDFCVPFSDVFAVKVGAVSGADDVFSHPNGNLEFVCSKTIDTGQTRRMFYNLEADELLPHKDRLLVRGIKTFSEKNWWQWGRGYPVSTAPRIYVNAKTRRKEPFFLHPCTAFDGSVLALFPKRQDIALQDCVSALNQVDWAALGFMSAGRHLFAQRALESCLLPSVFQAFSLGVTTHE